MMMFRRNDCWWQEGRSISGRRGPPWQRRGTCVKKSVFEAAPHLHIWIIHAAYKHIKWNVTTCHLKPKIRPSQLIIKMSNVSGWTHTPGSPPLVWWLYAQTIDKVSSYRLLRCWGLKRGSSSPWLLCRICRGGGGGKRDHTLLMASQTATRPYISLTYFETKMKRGGSTDVNLLN